MNLPITTLRYFYAKGTSKICSNFFQYGHCNYEITTNFILGVRIVADGSIRDYTNEGYKP